MQGGIKSTGQQEKSYSTIPLLSLNSTTYFYLLFSLFFFYILNISFERIQANPRAVIWSDAEGYYTYLPGLFILKDYHKLPAGSMWPYYNEQGEFVNKYSCGVAYFELPFFFIGRFISKLKGTDPNDYFHPVYSKAIAFGGILIAFLGLLLLYKTLIRDHPEKVVYWTLLSVFFGTNLFHYATKEMGMSHVYSFFLFAAFLFHLPKFFKTPNLIHSILLGGIMGWIFLIRPTNLIIFLLLPLYNVYSLTSLKQRIRFFIEHFKTMIYIGLAAFLMLIPQLMYWKEMTGKWIYYSYTEEGFTFWNKPKIMAVLFDVQNGLILYSPMVLLMLIAIIIGWKVKKYHAPAILLIFSIATYLFASWWAWWFGGAFGHRCYVEFYALLAIPLAGLISRVYSSKQKLLKITFQGLLILLMVYSVRLSYLYSSIGGPWDGPDWRWNWEKYHWIMDHFFKIF